MRITDMRVNHYTNPLGFDIEKARFTWCLTEARGTYQEQARIQIALDSQFHTIVYDSLKRRDIRSLGYVAALDLEPKTRYYWRVQIWNDTGDSVISDPAWFETAKMKEPWVAKWIKPATEGDVHPYLVREFSLPASVRKARIYVCGLGLYELEINGKKADEEYLTPFYNEYHDWVQYQTYDVTNLLKEGKNVVAAILGNGWYKGRFAFEPGMENIYGNHMAFIAELEVELIDGRTASLFSDSDWLCHCSPILESNIYDGEVFDGRLSITDFPSSSFSCDDWQPVHEVEKVTWG